jgi:hypothetical protein
MVTQPSRRRHTAHSREKIRRAHSEHCTERKNSYKKNQKKWQKKKEEKQPLRLATTVHLASEITDPENRTSTRHPNQRGDEQQEDDGTGADIAQKRTGEPPTKPAGRGTLTTTIHIDLRRKKRRRQKQHSSASIKLQGTE